MFSIHRSAPKHANQPAEMGALPGCPPPLLTCRGGGASGWSCPVADDSEKMRSASLNAAFFALTAVLDSSPSYPAQSTKASCRFICLGTVGDYGTTTNTRVWHASTTRTSYGVALQICILKVLVFQVVNLCREVQCWGRTRQQVMHSHDATPQTACQPTLRSVSNSSLRVDKMRFSSSLGSGGASVWCCPVLPPAALLLRLLPPPLLPAAVPGCGCAAAGDAFSSCCCGAVAAAAAAAAASRSAALLRGFDFGPPALPPPPEGPPAGAAAAADDFRGGARVMTASAVLPVCEQAVNSAIPLLQTLQNGRLKQNMAASDAGRVVTALTPHGSLAAETAVRSTEIPHH